MANVDETAPAHVREQPQWVAELLRVGRKALAKTVNPAIQGLLQKKGTFTATAPLWVARAFPFIINGSPLARP